VVLLQHSQNFEAAPHCGANSLLGCYKLAKSGACHDIGNLTSKQQTKAMNQVSTANDVRAIIANHLGVDIKRVTDEAHFTDDLGADWLDRLELMIEIENQFPAVEITDDDVDQIDVVSDLIRHLQRAWVARGGDASIIDAPVQ
jgi:acyl carrier protein